MSVSVGSRKQGNMTLTRKQLEDIAAELNDLTPAAQLRLAADLLDQGGDLKIVVHLVQRAELAVRLRQGKTP